jgi:hypothetical protein
MQGILARYQDHMYASERMALRNAIHSLQSFLDRVQTEDEGYFSG